MSERMLSNRKTEAGYNLIEVLVATALTGVVVLSIMTLFFLARRNVYSGKQMSAANAVATRVLEDLAMMTATDVLDNFNITNSTTLASNTVGGIAYPGSVLRDTDGTIDTTTDTSGYLARWKTLLNSASFLSGRVILIITPATPVQVGNPVTTAQTVRVRTVVEWNEGRRRRRILFDASKLQRP
jgi:Tfp pilus assembly protein PilV